MHTLTSIVEREGFTVQKTLVDLNENIFTEHQFDSEKHTANYALGQQEPSPS